MRRDHLFNTTWFHNTVLNIQDFADTEYDQYSYNPKIGFTVDSEVLLDALTSIFMCVFMRNGNDEYKEVIVHKRRWLDDVSIYNILFITRLHIHVKGTTVMRVNSLLSINNVMKF